MKIFFTFLKIVIFILALYILTQNSGQYVSISLLTYSNPSVSLLLVILVSLTAGAVLGVVFMAFSLIQNHTEIRSLKGKNTQLLNELQNLRNISVDEIPEEENLNILPLPVAKESENENG